ncbi:Na+/H+ antiporter NhaA [Paragemmobacter straminiformis]|uniref:Putative Na(+)/H(+) antiporter NhaA homolog n=1 Tax=Paragemmobacter straminiformis TaxID=2045119 RepID=A0A842I7B5_9RHOB|nr:Na+/H+ antiporter NhaA [Gemmobacter straminiformis]MBC2835461.1 Na+/H+ antiporter NhaA [Gemmobacter straminiformis]
MYRVSPFVRRFAWALLGGIALATVWVNLWPGSYYDAIEWRLIDRPLPAWIAGDAVVVTPMAIVSDVLMSLFLFFVGKELWEALVLSRGALAGRRAMLPAGAVLGAMLGSVLVWLLYGARFETAYEATAGAGWPVPIGSEIVIGYVVGRRVFGGGHPALHLLLLTTIASNILGTLILGFAYPATGLKLLWLLLPILACGLVYRSYGRMPVAGRTELARRRAMVLWPYVAAGIASWIGVAASGLPAELGLLPVLVVIPHADRAFGLFAEAEEFLHDPLNRLAHMMVRPLALVLFLFGLTRGGIDLQAYAPTTLTVLAALWIGKPVGLVLGALLAARLFRLPMPAGVRIRDLVLIAVISGMGFTAPVLAIDTALPGGAMSEAARLGLAISLLAGPFALGLSRIIGR